MLAVTMKQFGGPEVLEIGEVETPQPGPGEVLVRVRATALNRADLLQRRGLYPPPPGASEILGLEMAGDVEALGPGVTSVRVGDRVAALLPGGGYAQYAVVPAGMLMPLPASLSYEQGAAIPETFLTAYLNLFVLGRLSPGETVLVHAGASGVGTSAIQLIRLAGAQSIVTAGSQEKIDKCIELGAKAGWNYHDGSFVDFVRQETDGRGADVIFDFIGAPYFHDNLRALAVDGRLIVIGTMGGTQVDGFDLGQLLARRQQVIGTALRSRSLEKKIELTAAFMAFAHDALAKGEIGPVIDRVYDWRDVRQAHERMEANQNIGKIVLRVTE
ncbi:NAD(P)H-quinone oxidoreductase [Alicyclobacillus vulcanalis]|uniref:Putative NAD(P)H quinone oxidoreductase, PIG3 family n=1 Tax=Alicyclobacillus vulcanalis TaxID=252246 RepID=A0A1N7PP50_9BACL|nr:NAD(P)H-quinone oxidoreductase [Alicyclobacillus vulcanalis]SIT12376.1 putative NAD(P)H quinone oxidoreductase, PIG3 family [Alicyclobacillus vulcanalis]